METKFFLCRCDRCGGGGSGARMRGFRCPRAQCSGGVVYLDHAGSPALVPDGGDRDVGAGAGAGEADAAAAASGSLAVLGGSGQVARCEGGAGACGDELTDAEVEALAAFETDAGKPAAARALPVPLRCCARRTTRPVPANIIRRHGTRRQTSRTAQYQRGNWYYGNGSHAAR